MDYKIVVTKDAEADLDKFIKYLIFEKESIQAAQNVLNDYMVHNKRTKRIRKNGLLEKSK